MPAAPRSTARAAAPSIGPRNLGERLRTLLRRVLQFAVDAAITALLCLVPIGLAGLLIPQNPDGTVKALPAVVIVPLALLACLALSAWYWVVLPARETDRVTGGRGRTVGMRVFGLRVVSEAGDPVTLGPLSLRWAGLLIDGIGFGAVGLLTALLTRRSQRIGDLAAGTVVVSDPRRLPPEQADPTDLTARAAIRLPRSRRAATGAGAGWRRRS